METGTLVEDVKWTAASGRGGARPQTGRVLGRVGLMVGGYLAYVGLILGLPVRPSSAVPGIPAEDEAFVAGRKVWLRLGCQNCHSIYGLGGHLGPDLTNIASSRTPESLRTTIEWGRVGMPRFEVSKEELALLLDYLRVVDATGKYPPPRGAVFGRRP